MTKTFEYPDECEKIFKNMGYTVLGIYYSLDEAKKSYKLTLKFSCTFFKGRPDEIFHLCFFHQWTCTVFPDS
jgi:hypothetical protein